MLQGRIMREAGVLFLELHSDNKYFASGADLTEQQKVFPAFQPSNIKLLTIVNYHGPL